MSQTVKQVIVSVFFVGLLGAAAWLNIRHEQVDDGDPLERYGFFLKEVSRDVGINFRHESPKLDSRLDHIMPIIASMGAGVSVVDFDRSDRLSIYVVNSAIGSKNHLYRNKGDGTFEDVAEQMGIADLNKEGTGVCMGAVWGDFDNDGYEDLLVYKWGKCELYHNDKGKGFTLVKDSGLPAWANINSAIWLDYNGDGKLDLFLAGYWDENIDLWNLSSTKIMPESFEFANNGGRKYLLRGDGTGKFKDVTDEAGIKSRRWTLGVAAGNLCGGKYPDLFLANDYGVSEVLANIDGEKFVEVGKNCDVGKHAKSGMNASFGDVFNSGRFAVYVSNITEGNNLNQGNNLWVPRKGTTGLDLKFDNLAGSLGVENGSWSWGVQFADLNNDGLLDLYLTNGYISTAKGKDEYWYDYSKITGALKEIIIDAKNWPPMNGRSLGGDEHKCLWWNKGGKFVDIARAVGVSDTYDGRAVVIGDFSNHGMLDVVVANQNGPLLFYRNKVAPDNQWVQFELEGDGVHSNRSAIGAQLRLYWTNAGSDQKHQQLQQVSGGNGYASQNMRRLHFGLGKDAVVEKAEIVWPSGETQTIETPEVGKLHKIKESSK
jgi:hypothetical protein